MKKRRYIIIGIFLVLGFLIFNKTLSELKPIPKVTFKSQNLNYDKKEPGSFKVEKSSKWIGEGKAKVTIDVESIRKEIYEKKDILFLIDNSESMNGSKISNIKDDVEEFTQYILNNNNNNNVSLVTFNSSVTRQVGFTKNISYFNSKLKKINTEGNVNYIIVLKEVDKILSTYDRDQSKELIVLLLTDGFTNSNMIYEKIAYKEIKSKYPYATVNIVQYENKNYIRNNINEICDKLYISDYKRQKNKLFQAGTNPIIYDNFVITDYISKHFKGTTTKIKASQGEAKLEGDKVTWNLGTYRSGTKATLEIELEQVGSREEFYKTNKGIDIKTTFEKQKDDQISSKTPVLKDSYKVIYEANTPQGCTVKGLEKTTSHRPFEKIKLVKDAPTCPGYLFQGYKVITSVEYLNEDYVEMPEKDLILRAIWTKMKVVKDSFGKPYRVKSLYDAVKDKSLGNDKELGIDFDEDNSSENGEGVYLLDESKSDRFPIYFFRGTHNLNNNLIFADFCWKIVRTTDTGGVRVVYNGTPKNGRCTTTQGEDTNIGYNRFNPRYTHRKYVGYMYGDDKKPYENKYDSDIKKYIDNWYKNNIKYKGFETSVDFGAIYCGDRTESTDEKYAGYIRKNPTMKCPINDSFSVNRGNRKLNFPIGLLTKDEIVMAGIGNERGWNTNSYVYTNSIYWIMTPASWGENYNYGFVTHFYSYGGYDLANPTWDYGVRVALTLKNTEFYYRGNGSQENPYVI